MQRHKIARSFYHTKELSKSLLPKSFTDEILASLVFSIPIHIIAILLTEGAFHSWEWFPHTWWGWIPDSLAPDDINFVVVFRLLSGQFGDNLDHMILKNVYEKGFSIGRYIALVFTLSFLFGWFLRILVWKFKLDIRFPFFFRFGNYWLYRTTGRGIIEEEVKKLKRRYDLRNVIVTTFVEALVEIEGKFQVYSGMLKDFNIDENGELVDLILTEVQRHSKVREESSITGEERTIYEADNIPGDIFILKCSRIINFNFQYIATSPTSLTVYSLFDEREHLSA